MTKLSGPMLAPRSGQLPKQIVVLLHGYGADGADLIDLGRHWGEIMPDALFVAPNAPNRCGGNPFGYEWFPLQVDRIAGRIEGARDAAPVIRDFLSDLWAQTGLGAADTFLVGFSQGAMLTTDLALRMPEPPGGLCILSGTLVSEDEWRELAKNRGPLPVLQSHGYDDQILPFKAAEWLRDLLMDAGLDVDFVPFRGMHSIPPEALRRAAALLMRVAGSSSTSANGMIASSAPKRPR